MDGFLHDRDLRHERVIQQKAIVSNLLTSTNLNVIHFDNYCQILLLFKVTIAVFRRSNPYKTMKFLNFEELD